MTLRRSQETDGIYRLPFGWSLMIHDDGWLLADARSIIRHEGSWPHTGYRGPWWRSAPDRKEQS